MPLLIRDDELFEVSVRYVEQNGVVLFYEEDEPDGPNVVRESFKFKWPSWSDQRSMMADTMYLDPETGRPVVDPYRFMDRKIKVLLKEWSLKDNGGPLLITIDNIDRLNPSLIHFLSKRVDEVVSPKEEEK